MYSGNAQNPFSQPQGIISAQNSSTQYPPRRNSKRPLIIFSIVFALIILLAIGIFSAINIAKNQGKILAEKDEGIASR